MYSVPKIDKIRDYNSWYKVFDAAKNKEKREKDFVEMKGQMTENLDGIQNLLNYLWEQPIQDFKKLFFQGKNIKLLKKYNIKLI